MKKMECDVVVIGSGLGGMCAAARLAQAQYKVIILEKLAFIGGRYANIEYKGYQLTTGAMHYMLFGKHGAQAQTLRDLGIDLEVRECMPFSAYKIHGREYVQPAKGGIRFLCEIVGLDRLAREKVMGAFHKAMWWNEPSDEISFKNWLYDYTDNRTLHNMFDSFVVAETGLKSHEVPAGEWIRLMRNHARYASIGVPKGGCTGYINALKSGAEWNKCEFRTGTRITRIVVEHGVAKGVKAQGEEGEIEIEAKAVISNACPKETVKLAGKGNFDSGFLYKVRELTPTPGIKLVFSSSEPLMEYSGNYFTPFEDGGTQTISSFYCPSNIWRELDPPGRYSVWAFWKPELDLNKELELAMIDLRNVFRDFDERCEVIMAQAYSNGWPTLRSIPGQAVKQKTPVENLYLVGDGAAPAGYTVGEACAESARLVAEDIGNRTKPG